MDQSLTVRYESLTNILIHECIVWWHYRIILWWLGYPISEDFCATVIFLMQVKRFIMFTQGINRERLACVSNHRHYNYLFNGSLGLTTTEKQAPNKSTYMIGIERRLQGFSSRRASNVKCVHIVKSTWRSLFYGIIWSHLRVKGAIRRMLPLAIGHFYSSEHLVNEVLL